MSLLNAILNVITGEIFFFRGRIANGLLVILCRTLWISVIILFLFAILRGLCYHSDSCIEFLIGCKEMFLKHKYWYGALVGSVYASLYSRFSSQWLYLSNLYNNIKRTESGGAVTLTALNEWKAGFIEDAQLLHLAMKGSFVSVVKEWGEIPEVKQNYSDHTPGGLIGFEILMARVNAEFRTIDENIKKSF